MTRRVVDREYRCGDRKQYRRSLIRATLAGSLLLICSAIAEVAFAQQGLASRPQNLTCHAPDRPDSTDAYGAELKLRVDFPVAMVQAPGDSTHWYVVDRSGVVSRFTDGATFSFNAEVLDIQDRVVRTLDGRQWPEMGLLGIAFDPDFQSNGFVYVIYTASGTTATYPLAGRLSRFTSSDGGQSFVKATEVVLLSTEHDAQWHWGGNVLFGDDGYLYAAFGDAGHHENGQKLNTLNGKMIRIDVEPNGSYRIPPDNPFANGGGLREIYAYGLRNPWRWNFDHVTGELWLADVGSSLVEEVNRIQNGGNYGWSIKEGSQCSGLVSCKNLAGLIDPVYEYPHDPQSAFNAIIGGYIYRGTALPSLQGKYIFGDNFTGRVSALTIGSGGAVIEDEVLLESGQFLTSFAEGDDNELYLIARDGIYHLVEANNGPPTEFPQLLSETGCMDPSNPRLPARGVIPYTVNSPLWSDGASKDRWMALPDGTTIAIQPDSDWSFPIGTVLVKSFSIGATLVETRLFVRHDDGNWAGYTYEWNDAQTDATLLRTGRTKVVGGQVWRIPSEAQCLQCHTSAAGSSLGLETAQLNGDFLYPGSGVVANQLATLDSIGMFAAPLPGPPQSLPALAPISDSSASVELRARSYLHSNCSNCHRPTGPGQGPEDFRYWIPNSQMGAIGVLPTQGDLGVPSAMLISPGSPEQSIVSLRMHALDENRMPPLASAIRDVEGVSIVDSWIASLTGTCEEPAIDAANVAAIYVWRDCTTDETHFRATSGGTFRRYTGSISSDNDFLQVSGFSVEQHDFLGTLDPAVIDFDFQMWGSGQDGIDFVYEAGDGACLRLDNPADAVIRVGSAGTVVNSPINLETLEPCSDEPDTLGEPAYDPASEAALFVWTDITGRWHLRATPGGGYTNYIGQISAAQIFQNVVPRSIESHDRLDSVTQPNVISFDLQAWNSGVDGFDFDAPSAGDVCLEATSGGITVPVIVGAGRLEFSTPLNLRDLTSCSTVGDGDPPDYDPATEAGIFIWLQSDGLWRMRMTAGGGHSTASGVLASPQAFASMAPVSIEAHDVFTVVSPRRLTVDLQVWGRGEDGFNFRLQPGADACFDVSASAGTPVFFGAAKTPVSPPMTLLGQTPCTP